MLIECGLIVSALAGLSISLYFSLVYYNIIGANQWFIPSFCRMDEETCRYVIHTSYAKLLGIPNSILGVFYYAIILFILLIDGIRSHFFINEIIIIGSIITVIASVYLAYVLLAKVKVNCVFCFTIHILNVIILILLTYTNG